MGIDESVTDQDRRKFVRKLLTLGATAGVAGVFLNEVPYSSPVARVNALSGGDMVIDGQNTGSSGTVLTTAAGWTGSTFEADSVATAGSGAGIYGMTGSPDGFGLYGLSTANSGAGGAGVYGEARTPDAASGPGGAAVFGNSVAASGALVSGGGVGVRGWTVFPDGVGIIGHDLATSGYSVGIAGIVNSPDGTGIMGEARSGAAGPYAVSGYGTGVAGYSDFPDGIAVYGHNYATSGYATSIWGTVVSPDGTALGGRNTATSGYARAIYGRIYSPDGTGLYVNAAASGNLASGATAWTSGNGTAIQGDCQAPGGTGVIGRNTATSGYATGVYGTAVSPSGVGVVGTDFATNYGNAGVLGAANVGAGVQGLAYIGNGIGVIGQSRGPTVRPIVAWAASGQTANLQEWWNSSQTALSVVNASGSLGVGTGSPGFTIHGVNPAADGALTLECYSSVGPIPRVNTRTSRGTPTSPNPSQSGDRLFQLSGYGRGATGFSSLGSIALIGWCAENFTDTTQGAYLAFWTTPIGSPSTARAERLRIDSNGNIGIGTTSPTGLMDVKGSTGYNQLRMETAYTPAGTSDTNGNIGDLAWDTNYIYVKTGSGWKRGALSTF